jgi:hypothetical protein
MDATKAGYWIALGVLALGLNSEYRQGNFVTLHKAATRVESVACQITARAEETLAVATGRRTRSEFAVDRLLASTEAAEALRDRSEFLREQAQDEAEFVREQVRAQAEAIRTQAEMKRAEIRQIRQRSRVRLRLASAPSGQRVVVCPRTGARTLVSVGVDDEAVSPVVVEQTD